MNLEQLQYVNTALKEGIARVVVGQSEAVSLLLVALLAEGNILFEGVPGTAKTLLARTFSRLISMQFKRVQFTPDLLPGDLLGTNIFDFKTSAFHLTQGPIFTQLLLADEINRTPPKTQAALLEAMQERQVTIDGKSYDLGEGFMVVATQNPIEQEGTYPLPEAQLDRFLFKVQIGYPTRDQERELVRKHGHQGGHLALDELGVEPVVDLEIILSARHLVRQIQLSEPLIDYIVDLVRATRAHPSLMSGASPRACNMLAMASRAYAALQGRPYVIPDDIKMLAIPTLSHRLMLAPSAEIEGTTSAQVLTSIIGQLAGAAMIRPTRTFLLGMWAGIPIALLTVFYEPMWMVWVTYVGAWCGLGGLDLMLAPGTRQLTASMAAPGLVHLGEPAHVHVEVQSSGSASAHIEVLLEARGPIDEPMTQLVALSRGHAQCEVELAPHRRGELWFEQVHMRWSGPLRLFSQVKTVPVEQKSAVAPNIIAVRRAALHMASHNAMMQGAKILRFIGDGTEFEALREYTPGLNIRDVHWGATARHRKLLCRENRSERHHRLIIALDTGALMREPLQGLPKLDHAINAGLLLGFLSLKMGDQVGMFGFDAEVRSYLAPQPGIHTMKRLLRQSAELKYSPLETNYTLAMSTLRTQLRRRAIVVIFTDFMDSVSAQLMVENLGLVSKKHIVVFVAIRDASLDHTSAQRPTSLHDLNRAVVAGDMRREREVVLTRLRRQGIFCIDGAPEEISVDLINRYLDVHRRELI